jgi:hypothetical protein
MAPVVFAGQQNRRLFTAKDIVVEEAEVVSKHNKN